MKPGYSVQPFVVLVYILNSTWRMIPIESFKSKWFWTTWDRINNRNWANCRQYNAFLSKHSVSTTWVTSKWYYLIDLNSFILHKKTGLSDICFPMKIKDKSIHLIFHDGLIARLQPFFFKKRRTVLFSIFIFLKALMLLLSVVLIQSSISADLAVILSINHNCLNFFVEFHISAQLHWYLLIRFTNPAFVLLRFSAYALEAAIKQVFVCGLAFVLDGCIPAFEKTRWWLIVLNVSITSG